LLRQGKDSRQREDDDTHTTCREDGSSDCTNGQLAMFAAVLSALTMSWNSTETRDERNFETTISHDLRQAGVRNFCPFELFSSSPTTILEGAVPMSVLAA